MGMCVYVWVTIYMTRKLFVRRIQNFGPKIDATKAARDLSIACHLHVHNAINKGDEYIIRRAGTGGGRGSPTPN